MPSRSSTSGSTAATVADQSATQAMVAPTTSPIWKPSGKPDPQIPDQPHDEADGEADHHLLGQHPTDVAQPHLAHADGAHQRRHRLAADVAADADDERDVGDQRRHALQPVRVVLQHLAGQKSGQEEEEQPADAPPHQQPGAGEAVRHVEWLRTADALEVLGRLFLDDVGDVVLGDDAEQVILIVDDRAEPAGSCRRSARRPSPDRRRP